MNSSASDVTASLVQSGLKIVDTRDAGPLDDDGGGKKAMAFLIGN
jgi:hypothetical protein